MGEHAELQDLLLGVSTEERASHVPFNSGGSRYRLSSWRWFMLFHFSISNMNQVNIRPLSLPPSLSLLPQASSSVTTSFLPSRRNISLSAPPLSPHLSALRLPPDNDSASRGFHSAPHLQRPWPATLEAAWTRPLWIFSCKCEYPIGVYLQGSAYKTEEQKRRRSVSDI